MSFSGFSEDDIRKLNNKLSDKALTKADNKKNITFKANNINTNRSHKPKSVLINNNNVNGGIKAADISKGAKLASESKRVQDEVEYSGSINEKETDLGQSSSKPDKGGEGDEKGNKKYKDLDEFEARQKLIEEQNRKRKELLSKALADRTKQTQEEATRLNQIQEEFRKLDAMLSNDVKILRKQIELASVDYTEAQKRYHKVEKEFLEAKLLLHQKLEKKELLTEHLCAIIEKNEERKAEKLNELLEKLQVNPTEVEISTEIQEKHLESKAKEGNTN